MTVLVLALLVAEHMQCETQETAAIELLHTFDDDDDGRSKFLGTDANASTPVAVHAIAIGMAPYFLAVFWKFRGSVDYGALYISFYGSRTKTQEVEL